MFRYRVLSVLALTSLIAGCAGDSKAPLDLETERAALMQASRDWAQAAQEQDTERLLSFWTEDAIVMPPDQPAVIGKPAIREYVAAAGAIPGFTISWEPERATISESGDMGYLIEHNRVTMNDAAGAPQTQYGKVVTVWRKDADGAWKCVVDVWNNNPTATVFSRLNAAPTPVGLP